MVIVSCRIILSDHFAQFCVCKVPKEKVIPSEVKQLNKPWISRAIRIAVCKENELFYSGDKVKYNLQLYRNKILTVSQLSKK